MATRKIPKSKAKTAHSENGTSESVVAVESEVASRIPIDEAVVYVEKQIENNEWMTVKTFLGFFSVSELAAIMLRLDKRFWIIFYRILPTQQALDVFANLDPVVATELVLSLNDKELKYVLEKTTPDDRAAFFEELPGVVTQKLLKLLPKEEVDETLSLLGYPEGSVGRMMTPDYLAVEDDHTVGETLAEIRKNGIQKEIISMIFVVDEKKILEGYLLLKELLNAPDHEVVKTLMHGNMYSLEAHEDRERVVKDFATYNQPAVPIVDPQGVLMGIVTYDDIIAAAKEETTEDIQKGSAIVPLEIQYSLTTPIALVRKRVGWLIFLLSTSFLSSSVLAYFSKFMSLHIALSYFVPVLIGAGGNTGSQSATLVIRALSIGELSLSNWVRVVRKELLVGTLLGLSLALFMFFYSQLFVKNMQVGLIVSLAMLFVVLWSNLLGALLPLIISRFRFDPAVISNPFLSTFVDATGLMIYFLTAIAIFKI